MPDAGKGGTGDGIDAEGENNDDIPASSSRVDTNRAMYGLYRRVLSVHVGRRQRECFGGSTAVFTIIYVLMNRRSMILYTTSQQSVYAVPSRYRRTAPLTCDQSGIPTPRTGLDPCSGV